MCECAPRKGKRGILLEDSRVYFSQTIDLVEIEPAILDRWKDNSHFNDLLAAAILRAPAYNARHLLDLADWKPSSQNLSPELIATRDLLIEKGLSASEAEDIVRKGAQQAGANPWTSYDNNLEKARSLLESFNFNENRRSVEYVFVRDEPSVTAITLDDLIQESNSLGDIDTETRLKNEKDLARQLGIIDLRIIESLPILLAGVGYSRYFASPRDNDNGDSSNDKQPTLNTFHEQGGKVPIYVAKNTTEAFMFELDPYRLAAFLKVNLNIAMPAEVTESEILLRAWLLNLSHRLFDLGESHFVLKSFETEIGLSVDVTSALIFGVIHTLSHVLKATAHNYVGIDADALSEYLFPAQFSGLLYVSSHTEFTLGGIDSVFRANLTQWLGSAWEYAGRCSFDPVCSTSGGACSACLYPKFGCGYFNRTLSRAFLYGGVIQGYGRSLIGYWSPEVTNESNGLRKVNSD